MFRYVIMITSSICTQRWTANLHSTHRR